MTENSTPLRPPILMRLSVWMARIGGGLIFLMAFPITIDVITRKLFSVSVLESYEISTYIFAIAVPLGYGYALFAGSHIRIDVLFARLRGRTRALFDLFGLALLTGVVAIFAWQAVRTAVESFKMGARSNSTLGAPLALPQFLWAAGLAVFALICLAVSIRVALLIVKRRYQEAEALTSGSAVAPLEMRRDETS